MFYNTPPLASTKLQITGSQTRVSCNTRIIAVGPQMEKYCGARLWVHSASVLTKHPQKPRNNFQLSGGCKWAERREARGGLTAEKNPSVARGGQWALGASKGRDILLLPSCTLIKYICTRNRFIKNARVDNVCTQLYALLASFHSLHLIISVTCPENKAS